MAAIIDLEEATNQASNVNISDILRRNRTAPRHVTPDPYVFLELLATFSALTKILFGICSPLHIDAEALYKIAQKDTPNTSSRHYGHTTRIGSHTCCGPLQPPRETISKQDCKWTNSTSEIAFPARSTTCSRQSSHSTKSKTDTH